MTKLTIEERNSLHKSEFGLPKERKYPMPDSSHAANAKSRAQQQYNKGHISLKMLHEIDEKADRILDK